MKLVVTESGAGNIFQRDGKGGMVTFKAGDEITVSAEAGASLLRDGLATKKDVLTGRSDG